MLAALLTAAAITSVPTTAGAQTSQPAVAAIVKVAKPWYATKSAVTGKMRETVPQYESLPGLEYKMFSFAQSDGDYGGIYLWKDRASAQTWFNPAWFERVRRKRGVEGKVRSFDVPVAIDNTRAAPGASEGDGVATLVTIPIPAGVSRERVIGEFRAAIPLYQKVAGLKRMYFILTDDGRFGDIYLSESQASADAWFSAAWHERVKKSYGVDAAIEGFDTPILLPSKLADNRVETARP